MIALLAMLVTAGVGARQGTEVTLPSGPGPLGNPLKGFAPWSSVGTKLNAPVSMAYVDASWRDLEPIKGSYAFDAWEGSAWKTPLAKDKPVVLRIYMDYPGRPSGIPDWLLSAGLRTHSYSEYGGGKAPDYTDPNLQKSLLDFIRALGARYDKNPRVAYIELGLLGFWGEWHTYPHSEMFASDAFQLKVIDAYHLAFPDKPLMARNPSYTSCKNNWIGFHDDMIPDDSDGSEAWKFLPSMAAAGLSNNWKVAPIGGEMVPGAAEKYLGDSWDELIAAVKHGHMSWIGPYSPPMVENPSPQFKDHQNALERMLGYQFRLTKFGAVQEISEGETQTISLSGINEGVAPFYGSWPLEFVLIDSSDAVVERELSTIDVRTWLPGDFSSKFSCSLKAQPGLYRIGVGILDPSNSKPAVKFANRLSIVSGYTVLGSVRIVKRNSAMN